MPPKLSEESVNNEAVGNSVTCCREIECEED